MSEHTPTPWKINTADHGASSDAVFLDQHGSSVGDCISHRPLEEDAANTALIVRAVNAHEDLVRACKEAALVITATAKAAGADPLKGTCLPRLLLAIRKAEG